MKSVYVKSASHFITPVTRYHPRYQSRSPMYIRGQIPRNFAELAEAVPITLKPSESEIQTPGEPDQSMRTGNSGKQRRPR